MNITKRIHSIRIMILFLTMLGIGQIAYAATWYSRSDVTLGNVAGWSSSPTGTPDLISWVTTDDYIVQDGHILTLASATFNTLTINSTQPFVTAAVTLNGNVTVNAASSPTADGIVEVIGNINILNTTFTPAGSWTVNNLTVNNGTMSIASAAELIVKGNLTLVGTSAMTAVDETATISMSGTTAQTINVPSESYFEAGILNINNNVTTNSDMTIKGELVVASGFTFTANSGTVNFNPLVASAIIWNNAGTLNLNDVILNLAVDATASTNLNIKGNFTKINSGLLTLTAGNVTFNSTSFAAKEIQTTGGATTFFDLTVAPSTKIKTTSNFTITNLLNIGSNGELIADAGTITHLGGTITNNGKLEYYTLAATGNIATSSNFMVKDNFNFGAVNLTASAGTVTFKNVIPKDIICGTGTIFNNMTITSGSNINTASDFGMSGNLLIDTNSSFVASAGTITFTGTTKKTITNKDSLVFFNFLVADIAGDTVLTSSNFYVNGTGATAFAVGAANGVFIASNPSTISFTNDVILTAPTANRMKFYSVKIDGTDADVTVTAANFIHIQGDLTVSGTTSSFVSSPDATVTFEGLTNSKIIEGIPTPTAPYIVFCILEINKTGAENSNSVILEANIDIANGAGSTIKLTDGYLNLGTKTLTSGANVLPTYILGTSGINGANGTYAISTGHIATGLVDGMFTVNGVATLYNLDVLVAHTMGAGNLTVNNDLEFTGTAPSIFTIPAGQTLTLKGNLITTQEGTISGLDPATSVFRLVGEGKCDKFEDALFEATKPSLMFERGETLTNNLTMLANNVFTVNSSTQFLNIGSYSLVFDDATKLYRVSGGIDADSGVVVLGIEPTQTTIPANLFKDNIVKDLSLGAEIYHLGGDLIISNSLVQTTPNFLFTNNNTLTFGPNVTTANIPVYSPLAHIIGNLKRTVNNTNTLFPIGGGTADDFRPISLKFANAASNYVVKISSQKVNPTLNKGGDPTRTINALWTITPEGTAPMDTITIDFGWGLAHNNALTPVANTTFPARWNSTNWVDYRNSYSTLNSTNLLAPSASIYSLTNQYPIKADKLAGEWAIFVATDTSKVAKDAAISVSNFKLAIKSIIPNPVGLNMPFTATVELQNQYGNPTINTGNPINLVFTDVLGTLSSIPVGVIPNNASSTTVSGFSYNLPRAGNQFMVKNNETPTTRVILNGISPLVDVLNQLPSNQVSNIVLTPSTNSTQLMFDLTPNTDGCIIIARADSAIASSDYPIDGTTYFASANFGEGSKIGNAVVIYKGVAPTSAITVNGLASNTKYYFRGFAYGIETNAVTGTEKYLPFAAANNPKMTTTTGSNDDDSYATNNTISTAKPIGANTPIRGTIKNSKDIDWYSFTITNSSPNLRTRLTLSNILGNYNIEVYNVEGRRLRRGTRLNNVNENQIINDLKPGTYLVKIYGVNGAYDANNYYTLQLTTDAEEIFSVTE